VTTSVQGRDARASDIASTRFVVGLLAAVLIGTLGIAILSVRSELSFDFSLDEMWRVDLLRGGDIFGAPPTGLIISPIPPAWLAVFGVLAPVLPDGGLAFRLLALAPFCLGVLCFTAAIACMGIRRTSERGTTTSWLLAGLACTTFAIAPVFRALYSYFNNYLIEVTFVGILILVLVNLGVWPRAFVFAAVTIALSPLFALGALVLVPPALLALFVWSGDQPDRDRLRRMIALSGIGAGALATATYVASYRPIIEDADGFLEGYWRFASIGGKESLFGLVGRTIEGLRDGVFGTVFPQPTGFRAGVLTAATVVAAAFGAFVIAQRWRWYPVLLVSGAVGIVFSSVVADWPVTPVRVNIGYYALWYVAIAVGVVAAADWALDRLRVPRPWSLATLGIAAVVVVIVAWPPGRAPDRALQGLNPDLDRVADGASKANVVIAYHSGSYAYAHDRLVNLDDSGNKFVILTESTKIRNAAQAKTDQRAFEREATRLVRHAKPGTKIWCVVPEFVGAEISARACRFLADEEVRPLGEIEGAASRVEEFERTSR
jgi:hypothetical protein